MAATLKYAATETAQLNEFATDSAQIFTTLLPIPKPISFSSPIGSRRTTKRRACFQVVGRKQKLTTSLPSR
jgi:hypothetical protein